MMIVFNRCARGWQIMPGFFFYLRRGRAPLLAADRGGNLRYERRMMKAAMVLTKEEHDGGKTLAEPETRR
jgi:hypothetical protein